MTSIETYIKDLERGKRLFLRGTATCQEVILLLASHYENNEQFIFIESEDEVWLIEIE